jgi:hypothetical protein
MIKIPSTFSPRKLWVAANAAERDLRAAELALEERPIVADLRGVGLHVNSVWDLVNWRGEPYPEAVPILLQYLPLYYSDRLAAGIARALSRPYARALAWEPTLKLYKESPDYEKTWFKDGLAVALSGMARPDDLAEIIKLVDDRQNGRTRIFFLDNLSRSRKPQALEAIARHVDDPHLFKETRKILQRKLKSKAGLKGPQH